MHRKPENKLPRSEKDMKQPTNYMEWCALFDEIAASPRDEEYIEAVQKGSIAWSSGVAERFVNSSAEMIRRRINAAQDTYQKQTRNARGNLGLIGHALQVLKKEYQYAYDLAKALPIPEPYHGQIAKSVLDQASNADKSLTESAKADRTGHLSSAVRNAALGKLK